MTKSNKLKCLSKMPSWATRTALMHLGIDSVISGMSIAMLFNMKEQFFSLSVCSTDL